MNRGATGSSTAARKALEETGELVGFVELFQGSVIPAASQAVEEHEHRQAGQDAEEEQQHAGHLVACPDQF